MIFSVFSTASPLALASYRKSISDANATFEDILNSCRDTLTHLSALHDLLSTTDGQLQTDLENVLRRIGVDARVLDEIPYYENPLQNRSWEIHNLGIPNRMQELDVLLQQLEMKALERLMKADIEDGVARKRLDELKAAFRYLAQHAIVRD